MPQSVPTLLNAPAAPVKNLSGTKPPKPRSDSETSFHDALNQIKKKLTTPSTTTHKPPVAAKPAAKSAPNKAGERTYRLCGASHN